MVTFLLYDIDKFSMSDLVFNYVICVLFVILDKYNYSYSFKFHLHKEKCSICIINLINNKLGKGGRREMQIAAKLRLHAGAWLYPASEPG